MNLDQLMRQLNDQSSFLRSVEYGYIEVHSEQFGPYFSFEGESLLDKFANSKLDDHEQVVKKEFNNKNTLYICVKEFDVILVYDGETFTISQYWKRDPVNLEARPIDVEQLKTEILKHFTNAG